MDRGWDSKKGSDVLTTMIYNNRLSCCGLMSLCHRGVNWYRAERTPWDGPHMPGYV
jgi:hypothetical protein